MLSVHGPSFAVSALSRSGRVTVRDNTPWQFELHRSVRRDVKHKSQIPLLYIRCIYIADLLNACSYVFHFPRDLLVRPPFTALSSFVCSGFLLFRVFISIFLSFSSISHFVLQLSEFRAFSGSLWPSDRTLREENREIIKISA